MTVDHTEAARQDDRAYILQTYVKPDFVIDRGEGAYLFDTAGRRYLDFVSGIAVNALGYGDPEVTRAIADQAARLIHVSNLYLSAPAGELARLLIERSPGFDRVFFSNSGAEAIEGALKFARRFARHNGHADKIAVVAFDASFHGRTMGAVAVTGREKYREPFMPVMPGARFASYNDIASLEAAMAPDVCAVLLEPVQGEGGLRVASDAFLRAARRLCDEHGALLIFDEVQAGVGRTGTFWAHEPSGVRPDLMTVAKPLAGGLPIGAVLMRQAVADAIQIGDHGTTFGGNPLATAVGSVVVRRIGDPAFLAHVREVSSYLDESLHDLAADMPDSVLELRGRGLMRGLRLAEPVSAVRQRLQNEGLLVATAGEDVLRLLPPLIIEARHVDESIGLIRQALR
jgi:acetylornithine/N-succinyldiaminopimelate aminotransferase